MREVTCSPFSPPTSARLMPKSTAKNSTCSTSLRASASNEVRRDDVHQEAADAAALQLVGVVGIGVERLGVERRGVDVHAVAGAEEIGEQQADHERDRGHHLEIDQRLDADPSDLLEVAGAGNAVHDDAEHDRRHDHRDQLQKGVAENLQPDGEVGHGHAEHNPQQQRGQDLNEQRPVNRCTGAAGRGADSAGIGIAIDMVVAPCPDDDLLVVPIMLRGKKSAKPYWIVPKISAATPGKSEPSGWNERST